MFCLEVFALLAISVILSHFMNALNRRRSLPSPTTRSICSLNFLQSLSVRSDAKIGFASHWTSQSVSAPKIAPRSIWRMSSFEIPGIWDTGVSLLYLRDTPGGSNFASWSQMDLHSLNFGQVEQGEIIGYAQSTSFGLQIS
jgi:hypothetical protein